MPLDKQTNKPIDITSFTPDEEGYQDFMEATGGFSQVPIHEQPTMKIPAIHA